MWDDGYHCKDKLWLPNTNERLGELEGELSTEEAQIAFAKYCAGNPTFAAGLLTGVELYPFQDLMIRAMFQKDFVLAVCGRGLGKSYTSAMFALLYAIFNPGIKIGICSASFRQSRAVFKQIENFANGPHGVHLRNCIVGRPVHLPDAWEMMIGTTQIVAIPLGSGEKIRGYRFNVMIIDELLLLTDKVINEVIQPFMAIQAEPVVRQKVKDAEEKLIEAGELAPEDTYRFTENKMIGLTSASFEFEYLFELYSNYKALILDPKAKQSSHCIMQFSYEMAPKGLYSQIAIDNAKMNASASQFTREYGAQFTGDSAGYYSAKVLAERTVLPGEKPCTEIVGDPDSEYILAIDPNYNDAESADHFSMCLMKLNPENESATMVHGYALSNSSLGKRGAYMKYLTDNFNIVYVILDAAGGKKFIQDLDEMKLLDEKLRLFEHDFDNKNWDEGVSKSRAEFRPEEGCICHAQQFTGNWIRNANENLQVGVEKGSIWFASAVDAFSESEYESQMNSKIPISDLHFMKEDATNMSKSQERKMKLSDFIEHQGEMIKLTKEETTFIVVSTSVTGVQQFDLPPELKREKTKPDRARKDSYSTLLLGAWGAKCYYALLKLKPVASTGFKMRFIA
jgi:hypothetical protein